MIRVLFVTHCVSMAGANRSMLQLIKELRDDYGVFPFVLLPESYGCDNTLKHYLEQENIRYKESKIVNFKLSQQDADARYVYLEGYDKLKNICDDLRQYHFDIVHSNSSIIDFGAYISSELGAVHVWHLRDFGDLDYSLYSIFGKEYERLVYKKSDALIAISDAIKKHFSRIADSGKIYTIYNGIALKKDVPLAKHDNSITKFLCAGLISEGKNQKEILYALNELVNERHIKNVHVTIIGGGNSSMYAQEMRQYCAERQLGSYVSIEKEIEGISELASTMDVGIVPSKSEAFGRVTVEYMLQNLAVIANDNGANTEIIEHGKSGLIYPHGNHSALADCMQRLIQDKSLLKELAERGRLRAKSHFLSSQNTKAIYALYKRLLSESHAGKKSLSAFLTDMRLQLILLYERISSFAELYGREACRRLARLCKRG